jgi:hypothetical protein
LPYKKKLTYEDFVGQRGLKRLGRKKWRREVVALIDTFRAALQPEYIVLGGGNVRLTAELPTDVRLGDNANAFKGGFRLWEEYSPPTDEAPASPERIGTSGQSPAHRSAGTANGSDQGGTD